MSIRNVNVKKVFDLKVLIMEFNHVGSFILKWNFQQNLQFNQVLKIAGYYDVLLALVMRLRLRLECMIKCL